MTASATSIPSNRLDLIPLTPAFLDAALAAEHSQAERILGLTIPNEWYKKQALMQRRLDQLRDDPLLQPWLLRGMGLRKERLMVGYTGFHTAPDPEYLAELAPGGIELGYTVFTAHRRQGYAREACAALMQWARQEHGVDRFVVSISPDNVPSLRLAESFGFRKIGSHMDEIDGLEYIFERRV